MNERIQPPADIAEYLSDALKTGSVTVQCLECQKTFLAISYADFYEHSKTFVGKPDRWLIETGLHFCDNPDHHIRQVICGVIQNLTEYWRYKKHNEGQTLDNMREGLLQIQQEVAGNKL